MEVRSKSHNTLQLAVGVLAICLYQTSMAEEVWTVAKNEDGIKVYTRSVANSPLNEFKGEVELPTSSERVVAVLKDANSFRKWMPDVVVSDLLKSSDTEQYHYLENAAPWPVTNRDGVYHFTYTREEEAGAPVTVVRIEALPDYAPPRSSKIRVTQSDGFWKIVPTVTGVAVTYQVHANPGGSVPSWLANATVVDTPFKTLKNLRSYVRAAAQ